MRRHSHIDEQQVKALAANTVFYTIKGRPVSRIELYPSGANRVVTVSSNFEPFDRPKLIRTNTVEFSQGSRRRYFCYCNTLQLEGFKVYLLNCTIQADIEKDYIDKEILQHILKIWFKKIIRMGYDYVYKLEYTEREVPHLHILLYSNDRILFQDDEERKEKALELSKIWTNIIFDHFTGDDAFNSTFLPESIIHQYVNMRAISCTYLSEPRDFFKSIAYYSFYTSKCKSYQNKIPKKYHGIRCWGYGRENYGKINGEIYDQALSKNQFYDLYLLLQKKLAIKHKIIKKKNGFYIEDLSVDQADGETLMDKLLNDPTVISAEEYEKKYFELCKKSRQHIPKTDFRHIKHYKQTWEDTKKMFYGLDDTK